MSSILAWESPEPTGRPRIDLEPIIAELRVRRGEWALVFVGGGSGAKTRADRLRAAGCEIATRQNSDGKRKLYARFRDLPRLDSGETQEGVIAESSTERRPVAADV